MNEQIIKRILGWSLAVCFAGPALGVLAVVTVDHFQTRKTCGQFASFSRADQLRWLQRASRKRDQRYADVAKQVIQSSNDRALLEAAGILAVRVGATDLIPMIQKRVDEGPDDVQRAQLIISAARLSNRDTRLYDWLMQGVQGDEPWRRAGSAVGLLHIGRPESGPLLVRIVREGPAATRAFAMHNLAWIAIPLGQAIGHPMTWLEAKPPPTDAVSLDQISLFWKDHVTINLFNDVLRRMSNNDPGWAEMNRLIHARDKVARWLQ